MEKANKDDADSILNRIMYLVLFYKKCKNKRRNKGFFYQTERIKIISQFINCLPHKAAGDH